MRVSADPNGIAVFGDDQHVLTYHLNAPHAASWRCNFIHPLTSPSSACITEDGPADHTHHRGLFWAWRRVLVDGVRVDSWVGDGFTSRIAGSHAAATEARAELSAAIDWISTRHAPALHFVRENTRVAVSDSTRMRAVDITVRLRALVRNVALAGSDDEKGYGGPTLRFARSEELCVESAGHAIEPAYGPVETSRMVDFTWRPQPQGFPTRVRARCLIDGKPWTRWVLRRGPGMQNCAFPGRAPVPVPTERDLTIALALRIEP